MHCEKYIPAKIKALPINRRAKFAVGVLIILLTFLGTEVWSGFIWLLVALGCLGIYEGLSGNEVLENAMAKYCPACKTCGESEKTEEKTETPE